MDRRPPPAVSPRRLRPRLPPRAAPSVQTPPGTSAKTQFLDRSPVTRGSPVRPDYQMISSELIAMAKRVKEEFGANDDLGGFLTSSMACDGGPFFQRGRFYEVYSARRNERLKRKKGEFAEETVAGDPGVAVELAKRRYSKKAEGLRRSVPADFSISRASSLRSSVRSSKEIKKAATAAAAAKSAVGGRRIGARSTRRM